MIALACLSARAYEGKLKEIVNKVKQKPGGKLSGLAEMKFYIPM